MLGNYDLVSPTMRIDRRTPTAKPSPTKKDGNINCLRAPTSTSLHGDLKRGDPFARGYHTRERTDHRGNDPTYIFNSNHHYCVEKEKKSVSHVNFFGVKGRSSSSVGYSVGYKHILSMSSSLWALLWPSIFRLLGCALSKSHLLPGLSNS